MIKLLIALSLSLVSAAALSANTPAEILTEGNGYKKLLLDADMYDELFAQQYQRDPSTTSAPSSKQTAKPGSAPYLSKNPSRIIVSLTTLRGVLEARLPLWLQDELLTENGYQSWNELTDEMLDAPIAMNFISLDALAQIEQMESSRGLFNICEKDRDHKRKQIHETVDASDFDNFAFNENGVHAQLDASIQGEATIDADIRYTVKIRENCPFDFAYGVEFDSADVVFDASVDADMHVDGQASYELHRRILRNTIELWHKEFDWTTWLIQFELELDLKIDLGVELSVEAAAQFDADFTAYGTIGMTWQCASQGCTTSRNESNMTFVHPDDPNYAAQVRVVVTPYADTNFRADLDAYEGLVDVAKGQIGVVAALPIDFYGYFGNLCSDANGDGTNEVVSAQLVDISAQLYAYLKYELLGFDTTIPIDLGLIDYDISLRVEPYTGSFDAIIYSRSLLFRDLISGGSSVIEPVLGLPEISAIEGGMSLVTRSCYPYPDRVEYEIDWGDGSSGYVGSGGYVDHDWNGLGDFHVRARMKSDDSGRDFEERWVTVMVHVSPDGRTRYYPWLVPVISLILD